MRPSMSSRMFRCTGLVALATLAGAGASAQTDPTTRHQGVSGEWQTAREWQRANPIGPAPAFAPRSRWRSTLDLLGDRRVSLGTGGALSLHADAALTVLRDDGGADATASGRVNELYASTGSDAWQLSAGRRIIGWDVGQGFRPNDVVQREERRPLLVATPQGRSVVQIEHFGVDDATSLVWIDPQGGPSDRALALRHYRRFGALDVHAHAHWSAATRGDIGAALAWVATQTTEFHASTRWLPAHGQHQTILGASWT
ncbi:hypothetical protein, partial [Sphaerotilus sp.]|uniref:hypothetical protein n=1 Tax=Sphaerotilus sp. TaxID=2093942 RepID=UPI0034E23763